MLLVLLYHRWACFMASLGFWWLSLFAGSYPQSFKASIYPLLLSLSSYVSLYHRRRTLDFLIACVAWVVGYFLFIGLLCCSFTTAARLATSQKFNILILDNFLIVA